MSKSNKKKGEKSFDLDATEKLLNEALEMGWLNEEGTRDALHVFDEHVPLLLKEVHRLRQAVVELSNLVLVAGDNKRKS